jgi:catechol 2,3-dioxygenase-like lactoylglutathione lyase family enzyme
MKIIDVAFTCYAVSSIKKSRAFYEGVLGMTATKTYVDEAKDQGMVEYDLGPATFAIGCGSPLFKPGGRGVCSALEVEDFDAAVKHLKEKKVTFTLEPKETPVCRMALIADPDGNPVMIHRRKNR